MKKVIFCLTIAAFASVASLQAGEGKDCTAACGDKGAKVAKATECSKASACCSTKKANALAKGATDLRQVAKRS
jgi:hypothetical protein